MRNLLRFPAIASRLYEPFYQRKLARKLFTTKRLLSETLELKKPGNAVHQSITVENQQYVSDSFTNVTTHILNHVTRKLHHQDCHPLKLVKLRIVDFFYKRYVNRVGNPIFSVYDNLSPVVTLEQNFDSLLVPDNHPSRKKSDSYFINSKYMLRAHTSAHQRDLIRSGLDNFLIIGDVYRRDQIDSEHYPCFHQVEGVKLFSEHQLFSEQPDGASLSLFEQGRRESSKQESHTLEAVKLLEHDLKLCLQELVKNLFGKDVEFRWTETYFPFTHPSWELEIKYNDKWLELLGCGIMEQKLLENGGVTGKVGWAFGLGLERIAMKLYQIPDIRYFWSTDSGFLSQFKVDSPLQQIIFKPVSIHPPCTADMAFWIPSENFEVNDFYDLVRTVGGDMVEQVNEIDVFTHPKTKRTSYCFRIVYRHMERPLLQKEANAVHLEVAKKS